MQALARTSGPAGTRRLSLFRVRYLLVATVLVWGGYHYFMVQLPQYEALKAQEATLTKQLHTMQTKNHQLQTEQAQLQDKTYILKYAAEHYNLVMPNQVAFNVNK